jgi:hypothetical protein
MRLHISGCAEACLQREATFIIPDSLLAAAIDVGPLLNHF